LLVGTPAGGTLVISSVNCSGMHKPAGVVQQSPASISTWRGQMNVDASVNRGSSTVETVTRQNDVLLAVRDTGNRALSRRSTL